MPRHRRIRREIARDHALARSALCRDLLALVRRIVDRRLRPRARTIEGLHREIEAIVAHSRARVRALNDRRIERRGEASAVDEYGGAALGDFASMAALAAAVVDLDGLPPLVREHLDLDALAATLHVRGQVWSRIEGGAIRAFRRRRADEGAEDERR
ncbi:MAG: hypothetical protein H6711_23540 [Myxococcales bacterium]|nr:hypothetical protein [Myxococcales bacterium]